MENISKNPERVECKIKMRKEQRVEKAIKYFRKVKNTRYIRERKDVVIKGLQRAQKTHNGIVNGTTFGFILKLQKRFPKSFTIDELLLIAQKI